jgi:hypothetical protein
MLPWRNEKEKEDRNVEFNLLQEILAREDGRPHIFPIVQDIPALGSRFRAPRRPE